VGDISGLEAKRQSLLTELEQLKAQKQVASAKHDSEKHARLPEWKSLTDFVQLLSDYTLQTAEAMRGKRETIQNAEFTRCKSHLLLQFNKENPVSRETLGPLILLLDRL
jgi:hypothetical protein